jgi:type IV pilus assembly protein PilA
MPAPATPAPAAKSGSGKMIMLIIGGVLCCGVVPVIGILAAIAIPNFLKFQCKSKQSEAKVNLSGIYISEVAFNGEYNTYTTDLKAINWTPDGSPAYIYGFARRGPGISAAKAAQAGIADYNESRSDTANPALAGGVAYQTSKMVDQYQAPLTGKSLPADTTAGAKSFLAGAAGSVSPGRLDLWTIDEQKQLTNVENGCN